MPPHTPGQDTADTTACASASNCPLHASATSHTQAPAEVPLPLPKGPPAASLRACGRRLAAWGVFGGTSAAAIAAAAAEGLGLWTVVVGISETLDCVRCSAHRLCCTDHNPWGT